MNADDRPAARWAPPCPRTGCALARARQSYIEPLWVAGRRRRRLAPRTRSGVRVRRRRRRRRFGPGLADLVPPRADAKAARRRDALSVGAAAADAHRHRAGG